MYFGTQDLGVLGPKTPSQNLRWDPLLEVPKPLKPLKTPLHDYQLPRALQPFDFGPEPIRGAMVSPSAASAQVWGSTISSIAGTVGGLFQNQTKSITNIYNNR